MTRLDVYRVTETLERFIEGTTAFRNARDLAQGCRDGILRAANARARQSNGCGRVD